MSLLPDCCKALYPVHSVSLHRSTSLDLRLRYTRDDARAVRARGMTPIWARAHWQHCPLRGLLAVRPVHTVLICTTAGW